VNLNHHIFLEVRGYMRVSWKPHRKVLVILSKPW